MSVAQSFFRTTNYLVPSNGQTHAVVFKGQFSATPFLVDWRQFAIDNEKFQPQGAFVDNTAGTVPLVVTIQPINYSFSVPAGLTAQVQFPAPNGQTCTITGDPNNSASVVFVDFPVLPSGLSATITNTPNVNLASIGSVVMNANDNPMAAGNTLPYRVQDYVPTANYQSGSIFGTNVSTTLTPSAANQNLRKLDISVSGSAYNSGSSDILVTVTANGANCYARTITLPAAAPASPAPAFSVCSLSFDAIGIPMGAGNLVVTISHALTAGNMDVNAYFTPQ